MYILYIMKYFSQYLFIYIVSRGLYELSSLCDISVGISDSLDSCLYFQYFLVNICHILCNYLHAYSLQHHFWIYHFINILYQYCMGTKILNPKHHIQIPVCGNRLILCRFHFCYGNIIYSSLSEKYHVSGSLKNQ